MRFFGPGSCFFAGRQMYGDASVVDFNEDVAVRAVDFNEDLRVEQVDFNEKLSVRSVNINPGT